MTSTEPGNVLQCPDCGGVVSPSASACPHCGRPGEAQTIEATGKGPKTMIAVGTGLTIVGIVLLFTGQIPGEFAILAIGLGFLLYIIGRVDAWWRHG